MLVNNVNVLDLKRGDEIVIPEGSGRHRGEAGDWGCIEVFCPSGQSPQRLGRLSNGRHSRPRPHAPYITVIGYGDDWAHQHILAVPYDTAVTVIR